jgi:hypothetical protein
MSTLNTASMAFAHTTALDAVVAQAVTGVYRAVGSVIATVRALGATRPVSADDLLALAAWHEATNPSYAADLRAAAGQIG